MMSFSMCHDETCPQENKEKYKEKTEIMSDCRCCGEGGGGGSISPGYYEHDPQLLWEETKGLKNIKKFLAVQFPAHKLYTPGNLRSYEK